MKTVVKVSQDKSQVLPRNDPSQCDLRDAVLVQCVQGSVAVLGGGSLVHVPEAFHGRDVPLDTLLGEVEL